MNCLKMMRALSLSVALITPALHGMIEVITTSEELPVQLRNRGYSPLHLAAYFGREDRVAQLLSVTGAEAVSLVQKRSIDGSTSLHLAALQGHAGIIETLIARSPSLIDEQDNDGCTPLHHAATNGHINVLRCLIANGANIYQTNKRRLLPFHKATQNGHLEAMNILRPNQLENEYLDYCSLATTCAVESGKVEVLSFILNMWPGEGTLGFIPLMLAASYGQAPLLQWYLEQEEVRIDAVDMDGRCALHHAARYGHDEVARILLEREPQLVKKRDNSLKTPLHEAAEFGHPGVIELLLQFDSELDAQDKWGQTPLHNVARKGHTLALQQLINAGASLTITDKWGETALHGGQKDCVELLLAAKADIEAKDSLKRTPLLCAAEAGHLEVIKCLLRHGADIKQQTDRGNALVNAISRGHEDVVRYLIENTEVELMSCSGHFPGVVVPVIFHAVAVGNYKTTSLLIKKGTSLKTKLGDGRTVLHLLNNEPYQDIAIVKLLLRAGADMLCPDNAGVTPLDTLPLDETLPAAKHYFQNRSLYLSGQLGPEDDWNTLLLFATYFLDIPVFEALRDQLGDRLSKWRSSIGRNLLMVAIAMHDLDGIDWLLDQKICNISDKDFYGNDALLPALQSTRLKNNTTRLSLVNKLLASGASVTEGHLIDEANEKPSEANEVLMRLLVTYRYSQRPAHERLNLFK